ncbi:uncharacterized protein LOC123511261 [Portunus trituberculatus]|uniref:uncharacterized protein LOC123511261 n=1 Tax=Portunus trituberculatus TaxID=210409 RepID=UPI001E1CB7FC|nr:uncharacterized protein LOC123511261 [Portunus trituberculatus]
MSPKRTFTWTVDHDQAFSNVKKALSSPPVLATFDPALPTVLQIDASRLFGVGYILLQDHGGGKFRLVQCGSRFLTDAETRYATIELELVAVRLKEISAFVFTAVWRAGKDLCIPDALSHAPVSYPTPEDSLLDTETHQSIRRLVTQPATDSLANPHQNDDMVLEELQTAARADPSYVQLVENVKKGFPNDRYTLHNALRPYWKIRDELYCDGDIVLHGARVVVPAVLRRRTLARLHDSHRGAEATKRRARQAVYWPGIDADIVNTTRHLLPPYVTSGTSSETWEYQYASARMEDPSSPVESSPSS